MTQYNILVIDDEYSERKDMYSNFLMLEIEGVDTSFGIIEAETPNELDEVLNHKADRVDAIFMDARFNSKDWEDQGYDFSTVLLDIERTYENTRIPPCFIVSKYWDDEYRLGDVSRAFGAIHQLVHPSKYYRQEELLTYYKESTLVDSKGQSSSRAIREERLFIKSEIEKARKEQCNMINPADAVIIFAVNDEKSAAYRVLQLKAENDKKLKKFGLIYQEANVNGRHVAFVIQKEMGMTDASRITTASILAFRPKIVIMVGICAGKKGETSLGDIVIASGTFDYSLGKLKSVSDENGDSMNVLRHRPYHSKVDENLDEFLMLMKDPGTAAQETLNIKLEYAGPDRTRTQNAIHVTEMGSGPWVVDTKDVFADIANSIHSKAYVLDMEAYGVSHAADELKTPWLIVKAVQDFADGEKAKDESDTRAYASFASSKFVFRNIDRILKCLESE